MTVYALAAGIICVSELKARRRHDAAMEESPLSSTRRHDPYVQNEGAPVVESTCICVEVQRKNNNLKPSRNSSSKSSLGEY